MTDTDEVAEVAEPTKRKRHWIRRLVVLGAVAGVASRVARSRTPKRAPLTVVPDRQERRTPSAREPGATALRGFAATAAEPKDAPPEGRIKGNKDSMIYHTPDSPSYERTVAEVWFDTAEEAEAAGYRPPKRRGKGA